MRRFVTMLCVMLWSAFVPVTRVDGTIAFLGTGWVQTVTPVRANDGSGCAKGSRTVVRLSGETVCATEDADAVARRLNEAERGERVKP